MFFLCTNLSIYIPLNRVCNGIEDCPNGVDEIECNHIRHLPFFKCDENGEIIPWRYVCDFVSDCKNGKDEKYCSKKKIFLEF